MKKKEAPALSGIARQLWRLPVEEPHTFQVYQNVPLWDLVPSGQDCSQVYPDLGECRFRFVLCRGSAVPLALAPYDALLRPGQEFQRLDHTSLPGLLVVKSAQTLRYEEAVRSKLLVLEEESSYLSRPVWRYHPHPVPKRDIDRFCCKLLLEAWRCPELAGNGQTYYRPTDYGWDMGLTLGYTMDESGAIHCTPICSKERIAALKAPWSGTCTEREARIPLEVRLQRLSEGLPGDPSHNARVAYQMAGITLRDYTADLPKDLDVLLGYLSTDGLPEDGDITLWDAAETIYHFLGGSSEQRDKGLNALWYLARSIEYGYRKRRVR